MKTQKPKDIGITAKQFRNIAKLSVGVRSGVPPSTFNIKEFYLSADEEAKNPCDVSYECGASACFLGYGPKLGIKENIDGTWWDYARHNFTNTDTWASNILTTEVDNLFNMLFEVTHKNCPIAAARRGAYLLLHGTPKGDRLEHWETPSSFRPHWNVIRQIANSTCRQIEKGIEY